MTSARRLVIVGGSGFLGSRVTAMAPRFGIPVLHIDRSSFAADGLSEGPIDILDSLSLAGLFSQDDVVVHLAGPLAGDFGAHTAADSWRLQILGTSNVLTACARTGIRRFIFASSFYVYSGLAPVPSGLPEVPAAQLRPTHSFGQAKLAAERMVEDWAGRWEVELVVLRFGSLYGSGSGSNAVNEFVDTARQGLPIELWGTGDRQNQFTHVADAAEALLSAIEGPPGVFNVVSPEVTTTKALAELCVSRFGGEIRFRHDREERIGMPLLSAARATSLLCWQPRTLAAGLEEFREMEARQ